MMGSLKKGNASMFNNTFFTGDKNKPTSPKAINQGQKMSQRDGEVANYNGRQFMDEYTFEYPVLVYREEEPFKICLCNILEPQKPQISINLDKIKVKKFVGGAYMFSRYQTRSLDTNIAMICQYSEDIEDTQDHFQRHILMVLNFTPFNNDLMKNANLYTIAGQIPVPSEYHNGRI